MVKNYPVIFLSLLFLFSIAACKKKVEIKPPVIEVIKPLENDQFVLSAEIPVQLHIVSDEVLTYVKIGVEDEHQISVSPPVFLYPDFGQSDFNLVLHIDEIAESQDAPFYLHVKAENKGGVSNEFVALQLEKPKLVSKGFYLIMHSGLNETRVLYFDTTFASSEFLVLPNAFNDAAVSAKDDMIYISTKSPDKLQAFHHQNSEPAWQKDAEQPIPVLYNLKLSDPLIYTGTGNGRVWGYRTDNGNEQFITPLVFDSVPGQIGIFRDYVVADYHSLTGPGQGWLVFYKETAALFQKHSSQLNVQAFYPATSKNHAIVFGNIGSLGVIQLYDIENNKNLISLNFTTGIISASCQMEPGFFFIAVGKDIWLFNEYGPGIELLYQGTEAIVDLQYDIVSKRIYVAEEMKLSVYNATGDTLLTEIDAPASIQAIRLRLGY
jgi:hypothetical protein